MAIEINKALDLADFNLITKEKAELVTNEMITGDLNILTENIFHEGFDEVMEDHIPNHKICFMSLCTSSRPYTKSRKWKVYKENFQDIADFVVVSSGGLFPEKYWNDFVCLTYMGTDSRYDAKAFKNLEKDGVNKIYQDKMYERMIRFFTKYKYDYIFGDFTPKQRNFKPFIEVCEKLKSEGLILDYDYPPEDIKERCSKAGFTKEGGSVGMAFPTLHKVYFDTTKEKMNNLNLKLKGK